MYAFEESEESNIRKEVVDARPSAGMTAERVAQSA